MSKKVLTNICDEIMARYDLEDMMLFCGSKKTMLERMQRLDIDTLERLQDLRHIGALTYEEVHKAWRLKEELSKSIEDFYEETFGRASV